MTSKPTVLEAWPVLVDEDEEVCVDVHFHYYKGHHGSHHEPPEPESVEIIEVKYHSGAKNEGEREMQMERVRSLMEMDDSQFRLEMEDACLQMIADEEDRMADAHYDSMMEAKYDKMQEEEDQAFEEGN